MKWNRRWVARTWPSTLLRDQPSQHQLNLLWRHSVVASLAFAIGWRNFQKPYLQLKEKKKDCCQDNYITALKRSLSYSQWLHCGVSQDQVLGKDLIPLSFPLAPGESNPTWWRVNSVEIPLWIFLWLGKSSLGDTVSVKLLPYPNFLPKDVWLMLSFCQSSCKIFLCFVF